MCKSNEQELLNKERERRYTDEKRKHLEEQKQYKAKAERFRKGANLTPEQEELFNECFGWLYSET